MNMRTSVWWVGTTWFAPGCQPKIGKKSMLIEDAIELLRTKQPASMRSVGPNLFSFKD